MSNSSALLLLALAGLMVALACRAAQEAPSGDELAGSYAVERVYGSPVHERGPCSFTLAADGAVAGTASINRFKGTWSRDGEALTFSPLAATKMAGDPALMEQEQRLFDALARVERASVRAGVLSLSTADGEELVRASRRAD